MMAKRRWARGIGGLALLGGMAGLIAACLPREPLLLARATAVARIEGWHPDDNYRNDIGVHWIADDTLLFCRFEGAPRDPGVIYRRNVKTGREERLTALTETCNQLGAEGAYDGDASPDGRWLVCSTWRGSSFLAEVNGGRHYTYVYAESSAYRSVYWMPDGHHWLENYVDSVAERVVVHDTEHPGTGVIIPLKGERERRLFGALEAVVSPQEAITLEDPHPHTDGIVIEPPHPSKPHIVTVSRISLDARAIVLAQYQVATPQGSLLYRTYVSPQRDRIAWTVTTGRGNAVQNWLSDFLSFVPRSEQTVTEVWVSQLDGSQMHAIGLLPMPPGKEHASLLLQWLPDGKRLSFEVSNTLYTVPAD